VLLDIAPVGYEVFHSHRTSAKRKRGGGLAVISRIGLKAQPLPQHNLRLKTGISARQ
jgi:hypothetical protein